MQPRSLVAAIDQGTTSSRCILFDHAGSIVASHQLEHAQITPRPGWVEHDPDEIVERVRDLRPQARCASRAPTRRALAAVGISDQRETTVVWDRRTGRPGPQRHRLAGHPDRRGGPSASPPAARAAWTASGRRPGCRSRPTRPR